MAKSKSHLLYTKAPEGTEVFKYSKRGGGNTEEEDAKVKTHKVDFRSIVSRFRADYKLRREERNSELEIPEEVVCIDIKFWGWFNSSEFEVKYRADFGLSPIKYSELNTRVLFGVVDMKLFASFIRQIEKYAEAQDGRPTSFNPNVKYIRHFKFHTSTDILSAFKSLDQTIYLNLIDNLELDEITARNSARLRQYMAERGFEFSYNPEANQIEILAGNLELIKEISRNFDVVHQINSHNYMITRPGRFGTNVKVYPFEIADPEEDLPIVGVIDTGISVETPLSKMLVNDRTFAINGMDPFIDDADDGYGHGTAVAGLIVLGNQLAGNVQAVLYPQASVLSMKILSGTNGKVRNSDIAGLIRRAVIEHGVKIFNLTICYEEPLATGAVHSDYAFLLDKLSFELDILICICTANGQFNSVSIHEEYPDHFLKDQANFCTPADSMNSLIVGAIGDNLEPEIPITAEKYSFSTSHYPAVYARKYHIDYNAMSVKNRNVFKPDVVYSGGNYTCVKDSFGITLDSSFEAGLQVLSANRKQPIVRSVGTSYATPLIANLCANLYKAYPGIRAQTIKALIINSAAQVKFQKDYGSLKEIHKRFLTGYGRPDIDSLLYSDEGDVTLIFEEKIGVGKVKSMPVQFPDYLTKLDSSAVLKVEATLCFRFLPIQNNQLAYCPVNLAFGFFRNVALVDDIEVVQKGRRITKYRGISGGGKPDIAINDFIWSQDAFGRSKVLSNTQKMTFNIKKEQLVNESNVIKIGVQCHFHKNLPEYLLTSLPTEYEYSLIVRISEILKKDQQSGNLYSELMVLNQLELAADIALEGEASAEAEAG